MERSPLLEEAMVQITRMPYRKCAPPPAARLPCGCAAQALPAKRPRVALAPRGLSSLAHFPASGSRAGPTHAVRRGGAGRVTRFCVGSPLN